MQTELIDWIGGKIESSHSYFTLTMITNDYVVSNNVLWIWVMQREKTEIILQACWVCTIFFLSLYRSLVVVVVSGGAALVMLRFVIFHEDHFNRCVVIIVVGCVSWAIWKFSYCYYGIVAFTLQQPIDLLTTKL